MVGISAGGWAALIAAIAWAVLVTFLVLAIVRTLRVLESTHALVETMRQQTGPLLQDARTTMSSVNRELDKADEMVDSSGRIVKRAERVTAVLEQAIATPLIKVIALSAGLSRAWRSVREDE